MSGKPVDFYIMDEGQYGRWSGGGGSIAAVAQRQRSYSVRLRQALKPGTYYLLFTSADAAESTSVAGEFYLKYD